MARAIVLSAALAFFAAGCGSSAPQLGQERPAVNVEQLNPIFFGSGFSAPVHLEVAIQNAGPQPITVRSVRIEPGAGMGFFSIYPVQREMNEELAAGEVYTVTVTPTAYTNLARYTPNEPFSVRAIVDVLVAGKRHRQMYMFRDISR